VIRRWRRLSVVFPLGGFVFGAAQRQAGLVEGQGVRVEASVATMVEMSDVGDVALVEVVGSSSTRSIIYATADLPLPGSSSTPYLRSSVRL
jgi:hypothetical protein